MVWLQSRKRCTPGLAGFCCKGPESKYLRLWELNNLCVKCSIPSLWQEKSQGLCKWLRVTYVQNQAEGWIGPGGHSLGTPGCMAGGVENSRASNTKEWKEPAGSASWSPWAGVTSSHREISSVLCAFRARALWLHGD